jgi:hypothetical protein
MSLKHLLKEVGIDLGSETVVDRNCVHNEEATGAASSNAPRQESLALARAVNVRPHSRVAPTYQLNPLTTATAPRPHRRAVGVLMMRRSNCRKALSERPVHFLPPYMPAVGCSFAWAGSCSGGKPLACLTAIISGCRGMPTRDTEICGDSESADIGPVVRPGEWRRRNVLASLGGRVITRTRLRGGSASALPPRLWGALVSN